MSLTPAGAELLPQAYALLAGAQRFTDDARRHRDDRRALRIGLVPQLSAWQVARVVAGVRGADRPVITSIAPTIELVDAVTAERLDCAVVHHPALVGGLECGAVLHLPTWFLLPDDHPATRVRRPLIRDLRGLMFLRSRKLLHMDGHFGNMRTDGERIYLSDFGLATSPHFGLSAIEHDFARRNATHDAGYAAMRLVNWLVTTVCGVPVPASGGPVARNEYILRCAAGHIPADVPSVVAAILTRHAPAAATMNTFYWRLFGGDIHAEYPGL